MRKPVLGVLAAILILPALGSNAADEEGLVVDTKVKRVTVYSDRARVTRTGSARLSKGRQRVTIADLPFQLANSSVSAAMPGAKSAKILSIEVEEAHGKRTANAEAEKLLDKLKQLQAQDHGFSDELAALNAEENYLRSIQVQNETNEKGQPKPISLNTSTWRTTLDFASKGLVSVRDRRRKKEAERRQLGKEIAALNVEISKVRSYQTLANKRVVLEVTADRTETSTIEVTYALGGASWRPSYDVRVLSGSGEVEIVTYGVLRQSTSEDWKKVELTLSTASPRVGADLPELLAWRLGDRQQVATAVAAGGVGKMDAGYAEEGEADDDYAVDGVATTKTASREELSKSPRRSRRDRGRRAKRKVSSRAPRAVGTPPAAPPQPEPMERVADEEIAITEAAPAIDGDYRRNVPAGRSYGAALGSVGDAGGKAGNADKQRAHNVGRPVQKIRKVSENVWSLPAGATFDFRNAERDNFTYTGANIIWCPTPRRSAGGYDYAYKPARRQNVLSDGRERRIALANVKFPAELMHEIVAPLEQKAYLRASVKNDTRRPMLAGESFVFLDDDFVGRAFIETVAATEKLELSLGADDDVKVERRLEEKAENKGLISKKEKTLYKVLVTVKSFKRRKVSLLVRDQVPMTWQEDEIKITDVGASPKPTEKPVRGLYEWKHSLDPGKTAKFELRYTVTHPRDFDLVQRRTN